MEAYFRLLNVLEAALRDIESGMDPPVLTDAGKDSKLMRLPSRDLHHAILLKLVSMLSALNAAMKLLQEGHVMEQSALERIADEASEDVFFLALGEINGRTELHERFLEAFWAEEFDDVDDVINSHKSRPMVPRQKIRAYIHGFHPTDPSTANRAASIVAKAYSGFVHGAAPHIMEVYNPNEKRFSVTGMLGTPRFEQHAVGYWNYLYRGCMAFMAAAKAFGSEEHFKLLEGHLADFEQSTGRRS